LRPRPTILVKLLVAFAVPTLALFALFAYGAYTVTRDDLDAELGTRLTAVAASAATQLSGKYLVKLEPGNENDPDRVRARGKLARVAEATGVRLYVFDRAFTSRVDTVEDLAIGAPYYTAQLDRHEIARVFDDGVVVASVTFEGDDRRMYKAGYAPLRNADGEVVLVVGAQAPASYFDNLDDLRRRIFWWGAGVAAFVLIASLVIAVLITRPVRRLASAAERIGRGELDVPVDLGSRDEIGRLAETMDHMRGQLRERDVRTQQMLAGIAHEVRNPLAGMTLFTGILRDELGADDERTAHVERIAKELGYLERVVSEFLDYARRPVPELGGVELRALLDEVAQLVEPDAAKAGVGVEVTGEPLTIRADAGQLRRAVLNLARNAVQAAIPGDAHVRLGVTRVGDDAVLEVWDRGADIPEDARARLFEPFFTTREKGTGLGLAFVREIALDHHGGVDVTSGGGETTFRVRLPIA